jgi:hypothetical protein
MYSCWDWRFLFYWFSNFLDYYTGIQIENKNEKIRNLVWLSIGINLGCCFKYYNFCKFICDTLSDIGLKSSTLLLDASAGGTYFYTLFTAYRIVMIIHLQRRKKSRIQLVDYFCLWVTVVLVAGLIERAAFIASRSKDVWLWRKKQGVSIYMGLVKVVIADTCKLMPMLFSTIIPIRNSWS